MREQDRPVGRPRRPQPPKKVYSFEDVQRMHAVNRAVQYGRPVVLHIYRCAGSPIGLGSSLLWTTRTVPTGERFEVYFPDGSYLRCVRK